jgi:hypothetical protein
MQSRRTIGIVLVSTGLTASACSSDATDDHPDLVPQLHAPADRTAAPPNARALGAAKAPLETLGVWRGHFDGRKLTFTPLDAAAKASGIRPRNFQEVSDTLIGFETVESIVVNNGTGDSSKQQCLDNDTADKGVPRTYFGTSSNPQALSTGGPACENQHLCANVTVENDTTRTLDNLYVELSGLTPAGFHGDNSVTDAPTTFGLDPNGGLWRYGSLDPNTVSGNVRWNIFLPTCEDFDFITTIKGTVRPTDYTVSSLTELTEPFLNACSGANPAHVFDDGADPGVDDIRGIDVPFPFTLYGETFSDQQPLFVGADGRAGVTLGWVPGSNMDFPVTGTSHVFFPFWDSVNPRVDGVCYATVGSAPHRKFVVTWDNADIVSANNENLTFSLVLEEGTDAFEFQYHRWTWDQSCDATNGPNVSEQSAGGDATVGVQGSSSVRKRVSFNTIFLPIDGCPAEGLKYRFDPNPSSSTF